MAGRFNIVLQASVKNNSVVFFSLMCTPVGFCELAFKFVSFWQVAAYQHPSQSQSLHASGWQWCSSSLTLSAFQSQAEMVPFVHPQFLSFETMALKWSLLAPWQFWEGGSKTSCHPICHLPKACSLAQKTGWQPLGHTLTPESSHAS